MVLRFNGIPLSVFYVSCLALFAACGRKESPAGDAFSDNPLLAQYEGRKLHYQEIANDLPAGLQGKDSAQFFNSYVDRWLKDQVLLADAVSRLAEKREIEVLVDQYRDELMLMRYEDQLLKEKLDTAISREELEKYYQSNKSNYKLESTIFRFVMVKATKPVADSRKLDQLWASGYKTADLQGLRRYCDNNAEICFLNPGRWYKWEEIGRYIPSRFLSERNISGGMKRDFADFNYSYKIHFLEVVHPHEDPPLSFVADQAKRAILHERKRKLLEQHKTERYENELRNKRITIYSR
ncbi:MAG: hypothetical protein IT266_01970 [Saprospiraceae bacterium]|nr:hypothetical protein [Saprospiraceae bacterium]